MNMAAQSSFLQSVRSMCSRCEELRCDIAEQLENLLTVYAGLAERKEPFPLPEETAGALAALSMVDRDHEYRELACGRVITVMMGYCRAMPENMKDENTAKGALLGAFGLPAAAFCHASPKLEQILRGKEESLKERDQAESELVVLEYVRRFINTIPEQVAGDIGIAPAESTQRSRGRFLRRLLRLRFLGPLATFIIGTLLTLYFGPDLPQPQILGNDGPSVFVEPKSLFPIIGVRAEIAEEPPSIHPVGGVRAPRGQHSGLWVINCENLYGQAGIAMDQSLEIRVYARDVRRRWGPAEPYTITSGVYGTIPRPLP